MNPLSPLQNAVAVETLEGKGSVIVVARAGTGKTYLIVNGIVRVIYHERPHQSTAVMAFNKSAGQEVNTRLAKEGLTDWKRVKGGTCHSFGFAPIRKAYPNIKLQDDKVNSIIDAMGGVDPEKPKWQQPRNVYTDCRSSIAQAVSLAKQNGFGVFGGIRDQGAWYAIVEHHGLDEDLADGYSVDSLVTASIEVLERSDSMDSEVIDFDDMIRMPLLRKLRFWQYDNVIIDEAQDTNRVRRALALAMLKPRTGRLFAVGDDRQAIYGFTGADSDALELIRKEVGAKVFPLNVTYRCPKRVVELAKRLVPDYVAHEDAPEGIVRSTPHMIDDRTNRRNWFEGENLGAGDAILCRNTRPLIEEAYALLKAGIGCVVEGREIGKGLIKLATRWKSITNLSALTEKLDDYLERERTKWLAKGREEKAAAIEDRVGTLVAMAEACIAKGQTSVDDLVSSINSLFGDSQDGIDPKVVRLCSIHKSKGREWRRVFHLGREKFLPSGYARKDHQLLQEANLEYVAITRAQEEYVDVVMEARR